MRQLMIAVWYNNTNGYLINILVLFSDVACLGSRSPESFGKNYVYMLIYCIGDGRFTC
jgi:hypothetical protein